VQEKALGERACCFLSGAPFSKEFHQAQQFQTEPLSGVLLSSGGETLTFGVRHAKAAFSQGVTEPRGYRSSRKQLARHLCGAVALHGLPARVFFWSNPEI
jgi:hypothetical protein